MASKECIKPKIPPPNTHKKLNKIIKCHISHIYTCNFFGDQLEITRNLNVSICGNIQMSSSAALSLSPYVLILVLWQAATKYYRMGDGDFLKLRQQKHENPREGW